MKQHNRNLRRVIAGDPGRNRNRIDPYALNELDQRMLKESFRQARELQRRLQQTFGQ